MEIFIIAYIGVIGLLIGSFLNVVIYRLPNGETIVSGRSHCPSCGHSLSALDLVPVFSFLMLGRRCRYCRTPISWRYMIVESSTGIFFMAAAACLTPWAGSGAMILTITVCTLFAILLADALIQFDGHGHVSLRLFLIALGTSLLYVLATLPVREAVGLTPGDRSVGLVAGLVVLFMPFLTSRSALSKAGKEKRLRAFVYPSATALPVAGLMGGFSGSWLILLMGAALQGALAVAGKSRPDNNLPDRLDRMIPLLILLIVIVFCIIDCI